MKTPLARTALLALAGLLLLLMPVAAAVVGDDEGEVVRTVDSPKGPVKVRGTEMPPEMQTSSAPVLPPAGARGPGEGEGGRAGGGTGASGTSPGVGVPGVAEPEAESVPEAVPATSGASLTAKTALLGLAGLAFAVLFLLLRKTGRE